MHASRGSGRRPWAAQRGFSLLELIVVVIIIAVLAVVSIPKIARRMKDRRTQQAAQEVSILYRNARMRALGRGGAVLVRYLSAAQGSFEVIEAIRSSATCAELPETSCTLTQWGGGDPNIELRPVTGFDPATRSGFDNVRLSVTADGAAVTSLEVCFSPSGRTFVNNGATWNPLASVPVVSVVREGAGGPVGLIRTVMLLPNGAARLGVAQLNEGS